MFDFSLFSINSMGLRYGASKLFQILIPLLSYILIRDLLILRVLGQKNWVKQRLYKLSQRAWFSPLQQNFPQWLERSLGFMSWKIGCDLGFFLIATGLGPWSRAFTWAGLIPYTIIQYLFYYLLGRRVVVDGALSFDPKLQTSGNATGRPSPWKRWVSKYLHEDMNVTSDTIPLRQVILKPVVDYFGLVLSWSLYTIGLFFLQSGEVNWLPLTRFAFFQMLTFYLVNTYGYILGFNLGELIYNRLLELQEFWRQARRRAPGGESNATVTAGGARSQSFWQITQTSPRFDGIQTFIDRYGLTPRWVISAASGVLCIMLLAPNFAGLMFNVGESVHHTWFQLQGNLSESQSLQVEQSFQPDAPLPDSQQVIDRFPEIWSELYLAPAAPAIALQEISPGA